MENTWMTAEEVAEYLGFSLATLYRLMKKGEITYYQASQYKSTKARFRKEDVDKYLESMRVN